MPPRSNTEIVQELSATVGELRAQVAVLKSELDLGEPTVTAQRVARLEVQVVELVKARDESARRAAQFAMLAVGALFTVAVQLVIKSLGK